MSDKYTVRITKIVIIPVGEPIFSERATEIEIDDEAAGEFVKITQHGRSSEFTKIVCFDPDEWAVIKPEIDKMIGMCEGCDL